MPPFAILTLLAGCLLPALLIAWAAGFAMRRVAPRCGLIDRPAARKVHTTPTPLGGGVAVWLGVITPFALGQIALWMLQSDGDFADSLFGFAIPEFAREHLPGIAYRTSQLWVLLAAGTVLMLLGLADDRFGLDWKIRLGVMFAVSAACVVWQGWRLTAFVDLPWFTGLLSVVWIVAMINSFNMLDNMDGLSSGVACIAAGMFAAVMLLSPDPESQQPQFFVAGLMLVLTGSLLGFLWHNRPVARMFMGDAGSYFIGFLIAVATLLATYTSYKSESRHAILAPLCVMAVPMYDMLTVLWIRVREGRSPFQADKCHFSHRLVELGFTKGQAVLTIYLTTATCGLAALLLHQVNQTGAVILVLMVFCVLALIAILESTARHKLKADVEEKQETRR
ncbi:MraY family glycosyltransferase [Lignipirellula cremea]|uniref:WecA-like glycosyltransferase n=1 Tax=Lignipirellula cremea TaxID=2528010 RepID=A0A518DQ42_9BACT|nr:MraY family glycosyltransferase [Lignipirellula cremea]QDU93947.1 WecA-like glycosyltransferase [Lignipirellula cremea]